MALPNSVEEVSSTSRATTIPELHFEQREVDQFKVDDAQAGRILGKMLSCLFVYTALAMSIVIFWTLRTLAQ